MDAAAVSREIPRGIRASGKSPRKLTRKYRPEDFPGTWLRIQEIPREIPWMRRQNRGKFPGGSPGNAFTGKSHWWPTENEFPGTYPVGLSGCLPMGRHIAHRGGFPRSAFLGHLQNNGYQQSYRGKARRRRPFPLNSPANRPDSPIPAALYSVFRKFFAHPAASGFMRGRG